MSVHRKKLTYRESRLWARENAKKKRAGGNHDEPSDHVDDAQLPNKRPRSNHDDEQLSHVEDEPGVVCSKPFSPSFRTDENEEIDTAASTTDGIAADGESLNSTIQWQAPEFSDYVYEEEPVFIELDQASDALSEHSEHESGQDNFDDLVQLTSSIAEGQKVTAVSSISARIPEKRHAPLEATSDVYKQSLSQSSLPNASRPCDNSSGSSTGPPHVTAAEKSQSDRSASGETVSSCVNTASGVLRKTTISVNDDRKHRYADEWDKVEKILNQLVTSTRDKYIVGSQGLVDSSNKDFAHDLKQMGDKLVAYGGKFITLSSELEARVEQREFEDILEQDREVDEVESLPGINSSSESDNAKGRSKQDAERQKIVSERKQSKQDQIEKQKASDAEVKGFIQVISTPEGGTKKLYICGVCEKQYSSNLFLVDHLRRHTSQTFQCTKCDLIVKSKMRLQAHMNFHEHGPWKCDYCSKEFKWESSYLNHKSSHEQKHPFVCNICKKTFVKKQRWKDHTEFKHTTGKTVQCPLCEKKCKTKNALSTHFTTAHKERDEKGRRK